LVSISSARRAKNLVWVILQIPRFA
jgi:hypothetical protein